jgi:large subunit ribosomal protein L24
VNVKVKIRKGDTVKIITGKEADKGKEAVVIHVLHKEGRLAVQGINIRKKHQRAMQQQGRQINPGIVEFEGLMAISNVMLVCPKCKKPARVRIERDADGSAHRICKNCGQRID